MSPVARLILLSVVLTTTLSANPCPVCFEDLTNDSDTSLLHPTPAVATRMPCSHSFHIDCIRQWIHDYRHNTCPMCRAKIAEHPPAILDSSQNDDSSLGILFGIGGTFGTVGLYFLITLIGMLRESDSPGTFGIFQRIILGLFAAGFLMSAVSSFKFGYALREEALSGPDDGDDHEIGWVMGAADVMGVNFQH